MEDIIIPENFYRVSVKALILDASWKFLLIKTPQSNLWDLVGWWINFWETPEECLRREIREEMHLEIIHFDSRPCYFYTVKVLHSNYSLANIVYQIILNNLEFTPTEECDEIWFFNVKEAKNLKTYPRTQEFFKLYNANNHI